MRGDDVFVLVGEMAHVYSLRKFIAPDDPMEQKPGNGNRGGVWEVHVTHFTNHAIFAIRP